MLPFKVATADDTTCKKQNYITDKITVDLLFTFHALCANASTIFFVNASYNLS